MIERDFRITGVFRKQIGDEKAPKEFAKNGYWKVEKGSNWW